MTTRVTGGDVSLPYNQVASSTVPCPTGMYLTGGGFQVLTGVSGTYTPVSVAKSGPAASGEAWEVAVQAGGGVMTAYAICIGTPDPF